MPGGCPSSDPPSSLGRLACQLVHMPRSAPGFSDAPCIADGCLAVAANRSVAGAPVPASQAGALGALRAVGCLVLTLVEACQLRSHVTWLGNHIYELECSTPS